MGLVAFSLVLLSLLGNTDIDSLDARLARTRLYLDQLEARQATSEEILLGIHEHLAAARDYYNQLAAREVVLTMDIRRLDQRWFLTDSARSELEAGVEDYIMFLYSRRNLIGPAVLFAPGGVNTYLRRMAMINHMAGTAVQRIEYLEQSGDSLARYRDSLETLAESVRSLRITMEEVQQRIYQEEERQITLRHSLQNQIAAARDSAAAMEQRRQQLSAFVSTLRTGVSAPVHDVSDNAYLASRVGSVPWPVQGTIVRYFGTETDPVYGTETISDGVSIAVPGTGAAVSAIGPGTVLYAEQFLNMGRMVVLDHNDGYYSVYAHLGSLEVTRGQELDAGSRIGSTGPLPGGRSGCYLEIRRAGRPVDPLGILQQGGL